MDQLLRDLRLGARMLRRTPTSSAISILALTLGIGLTALMFSILYGAMWRGLPFEKPEQLLYLDALRAANGEDFPLSIHDFADLRAQQRSFEDLAAFVQATVNISGDDRPERYNGALVTPSVFRLARVQPVLGRTFTDEEDRPGTPGVIVLGYSVWRDRFRSTPGVLGRTLRANGQEVTIIGVMPEGFRFPNTQDVWMPMRANPLDTQRGQGRRVAVFGRMRDGVSMDAAAIEFDGLAKRLAQAYPATNEGVSVNLKPFMEEMLGDEERSMLLTMLGAVFLVLLMGCANVANLLMSRTALRIKEVGIRSALGAGKRRIAIQFLTEAFLLAFAGGALGLLVAWIGIGLFNGAIASTNPPFWLDIRLDGILVLFVGALCIVAALTSGTLPALQAASANINDILKDESRGSSSFRIGRISRGLVVLDIALSVGLLAGAGLMIRSIMKLGAVDVGFATETVFTARLTLPELDYPDATSQLNLYDGLLPRLEAIPGVTSVALSSALPVAGSGGSSIAIEGVTYEGEHEYPDARQAVITPRFFETFETAVVDGRAFDAGDREGSLPVAIVNQSFARRHWPGESPLGRRLRIQPTDTTRAWLTVIGIAPDLYMDGLQHTEPEGLYVPLAQNRSRNMSIAAKTQTDALAFAPAFRDAVGASDPDLPLYFVDSLAHAIESDTWFYRVFGSLFMIFGLVALLLAAVGLYGVMSFSVGQRTREMGVRMALGAQPRSVLAMIMRQGMKQLAIGLALGLALSLVVSRLMVTLLFGVSPRDPVTFLGIAVVLALTTGVACFVPARRATRVDPVNALRYE